MTKKTQTQKPATVTVSFQVTPETARLAATIPAQDARTGKPVVPPLDDVAKTVFLQFVRANAKME